MFTAPLTAGSAFYDLTRSLVLLVILVIASTPLPNMLYQKLKENKVFIVIWTLVLPFILLVCTAYLVDSSYNPFLYFRF